MSKIEIYCAVLIFFQLLKSPGSAFKTFNSLIKIVFAYSNCKTNFPGSRKILHIMFSENLYRDNPVMRSCIKSGFVLKIAMYFIRYFPYVFRGGKSNFFNFLVTIKINQ